VKKVSKTKLLEKNKNFFFSSSPLVQHALTASLPGKRFAFHKSTLTSMEWRAASSAVLSTQLSFYANSLNIHWRSRKASMILFTQSVLEDIPGFWPSCLQILKDFVWCGAAPSGNLKCPSAVAWCLRLSTDMKPGRPQMNFHSGGSPTAWERACQKYMLLVCYEIKKNYECIWQGDRLSSIFLQVIALEVEATNPSSQGVCSPHITTGTISN